MQKIKSLRSQYVALLLTAFALFTIDVFSIKLSSAQSKVYVDIGEARLRKSKLAMPLFTNMNPNPSAAAPAGNELFAVVSNDLAATGLFATIEPDAYLEDPSTKGLKPVSAVPNGFNFDKWKAIGTEFLIRAGYNVVGDKIILEAYAYFVPQGTMLFGKRYEAPLKTSRRLAHTFADDFIAAVTGKPSFFKSQIVVAIDGGPKTHREVYIADWDGYGATAITNHRSTTVSPTWSKNGEFIAYSAYIYRKLSGKPARQNLDLFMYEVRNKRRWLVSYREGLNSGAEFTPDSQKILVTLTVTGTADIYLMTLDGKSITPLTRGPGKAMNVEPAVSPDGTTVAFSSDKSGNPMIYTMSLNGTNVVRKTFAGHYNSTPTWSPDSKKIAFAGLDKEKGNFDLFVMNKDTTGLIRLTSARKTNGKWANNEDPAFSPDGRHVLFVSDRTGTKQLYIVNIDGSNERRITFDNKFYSRPKWGPRVD